MIILGIETSCDETAASVVENGTKVLSSEIASSMEIHVASGGIIPEQAARKQIEYIIPVIDKALKSAFPDVKKQNDRIKKIDCIAVTYGPGLIGSLLVGVETAKTLSYLWKKPLIPVNHLVAHIYANFVDKFQITNFQLPKFPVIALVVSGGHTDLVLMKKFNEFKRIGGTRDDAAGEAFDKCARIIRLPYPGGPAIATEAAKFEAQNPKSELNLFPRPMINTKDFDWSFSGLKTAVLNYTNQNPQYDIEKTAAEIQEAIVDVLVTKSVRAVKKFKPKSFLLSGGVAANSRLKEKFEREFKLNKLSTNLFIPPAKICTDNAVTIASCAYFNQKKVEWSKVLANPQLTITDN